jgi:unsaturated rhamnogalacturonyl hydrolase
VTGAYHRLILVPLAGLMLLPAVPAQRAPAQGAPAQRAPAAEVAAPPAATVYEAEAATLDHAGVANANAGFSGTGYVAYDGTAGGFIEWTVDAPRPGEQALTFRFSAATPADLPVDIAVNGTVVTSVSFPPTGGGSGWQLRTVRVRLAKGRNTVRATTTGPSGGPNLDWLAVGEWRRHVDDWSVAVVESTMRRTTPARLGGWGYTQGLYLYGQYLVYQRTGDPRYLAYIRQWADRFVDAAGNISNSFNNLDSMQSGNVLLILYQETGDVRYRTAADKIRRRLDTYPRTADGGFWHATSRQHQLWSDGVFMVLPFLVRYGKLFGDSAYANDEVANQLLIYARHLQVESGLFIHAWDESGLQPWADPVTHRSPEHWCRAIGWYGMASTQVLDELPADHPQRQQIIDVVRRLVAAMARYQDPGTGRWFQVVDKGGLAGNWTETSCSSMYTYTIAKAVQRGYVSRTYLPAARQGYRGVLARAAILPDGLTDIVDICIGTNVGDLAFYFARPRATNDLHGLGAFLLMNELVTGGV